MHESDREFSAKVIILESLLAVGLGSRILQSIGSSVTGKVCTRHVTLIIIDLIELWCLGSTYPTIL